MGVSRHAPGPGRGRPGDGGPRSEREQVRPLRRRVPLTVDYSTLRGWRSDGQPTMQTLKRLTLAAGVTAVFLAACTSGEDFTPPPQTGVPTVPRVPTQTATMTPVPGATELPTREPPLAVSPSPGPSPTPALPRPAPELSPGPPPPPVNADARASGWLRTDVNRIVDESGQPVRLHGVNLENREWLWPYGPSIAYELEAIPLLTAPPPDGWGANLIVLAIASSPVNRGDELYLGQLDTLVGAARERGAYTLLVYRYPTPNGVQPPMPDQAAEDAMALLAHRYANESSVLYGLQVEPSNVTWEQLRPRFTTMVDAIRAGNPNSLIVVPGTDHSRYIWHVLNDPVPRENLIYKTHFYDAASLLETDFRLPQVAARYPVLIGEFGAGVQSSLEDVRALLDLADKLGISWAAWLFNDQACPCLLASRAGFVLTPYGEAVRARLQALAGTGMRTALEG